jgi:regulator of RNase E activity RraA
VGETLDPAVLGQLAGAGTATVSSQLARRGLRSVLLHGVCPVSRGRSLVGVARTVRFVPAREDLTSPDLVRDPDYPQRAMIEHARPGDVLVFDCRGELGAAAVGDLLLTRLEARGAAGLVADGAVRDAAAIAEMAIPVFAAGATPLAHTSRHQAVDSDVPIACGGVQVRPGDVMLGDADGVLCIPRSLAAEVARDAAEQAALEQFVLAKLRGGAPLPGAYPPDEQTLAEYRRGRAVQ